MKKRYFNLWCISLVLFSSAIVMCAENNNGKELEQRIVQHKKMINERQIKQRWLWSTANIVGPLGLLIGLGVYQWYKSPSINQEIPLQPQQPEIALLTPVEAKKQIATPEDVAKYFKASKAYGASAVYFTVLALFDPFFYPYVAATYMGSLYYGVKGIQPRLNPVSLDEIVITPPDLPY